MTMKLDFHSNQNRMIALAVGATLLVLVLAVWWFRSAPGADEPVGTQVPVQVGTIRRMDVHSYVLAYGAVETEPAKGGQPGGGAKLSTSAAGTVLAISVREGQAVKAGDIIVRLDSRMNQAAMDKASASLSLAEQQLSRQQQMLAIGGTSQKAVQMAQQQLAAARAEVGSARGALALTQLASPVNGIVARINVNPGQTVDPNTIVAEIVDLNRLIVTASVPAPEAASLKAGQSAMMSADDTGKVLAQGSVSFVSPVVDGRTNTALIRITVPPNSALRPGQTVTAKIVSETHRNALAVPFQSVVKADGTASIYLVKGQKASQRTVTAGFRDGDFVEVQGNGLQVGDTVVTTGAYGLPAETEIRVVSQ